VDVAAVYQTLDVVPGIPELEQLPVSNDAVLLRGQRSQPPLTWTILMAVTALRVVHVAHAPDAGKKPVTRG
jgi:hypothetical protein